jgi:Tol biopolymer transport system component
LRHEGPSIEAGARAYLGTLDNPAGRELLAGAFNAQFIPPNLLLFTDSSGIKVQRIDVDRGQMEGDIEEVSADVDRHRGHAALTVSRSGTLAYAAGSSRNHRLVWVDRTGRETGVAASPDGWRDIALSPNGSHAAVQRIVPDANDIWIIDLLRGVPSRFTFSPEVEDDPVWSPDGTTIAYSSVRDGVSGIYQKVVGGAGADELLFANRAPIHPTAWSPDGRFLLFEQTNPVSGSDVWVLPLQGDRTPYPYLATTFSEGDAHFSPDGKWVAYTSDESGRNEVYVQSFPDVHEKLQISLNGGATPRWAPSGGELYFLSIERRLMAVTINLTQSPKVGTPTALFDAAVDLGTNRYVPNHDGKRFLLSVDTPESVAAHLVVVVNFLDQLALTHVTH